MARAKKDPRTGLPFGDHGTGEEAINFLLAFNQAPGEETSFLRCWREGNLDEWPEYYKWLKLQRKRRNVQS